MPKTKLLLVSSGGGHLYQLYCLKLWWKNYDRVWVTKKSSQAKELLTREKVVFGYFPETRNIGNAWRNLVRAWNVLGKERPQMVVSMGAGIAPPYFFIAWLKGIRTVFIDSVTFIHYPSLSARMCYFLGAMVLTQHKAMTKRYPWMRYKGGLL